VVTGASSGLGRETARALASHGAAVVLAARDEHRLATASGEILEQVPGCDLSTCRLDLTSLAEVRTAADELRARYPEIDLLINNAGVMACPFARTTDGFEMQFGTNHLGHFLFTTLLLDNLLASGSPRVVCVSSAGHRESPILWDDPNFERTEYDKWVAYGQSKTANALFALELDRRYAPSGLHAYSVHPGVIMTPLARHLGEDDLIWLSERAPEGGIAFKSVEAGAATTVWAATARELDDHGGAYLEDCGVARLVTDPRVPSGVRDWARDPEAARRLWELSETLTA
jgi:NAD(P)-dependent dehydrogenase (short-subunit alcohol dehydrogenase family)